MIARFIWIFACVVLPAGRSLAQTFPSTRPTTMHVMVTTLAGVPIPSGNIQVENLAGKALYPVSSLGSVDVPIPAAPSARDFLRVTAFVPGYVQAYTSWSDAINERLVPPATLTIPLRNAATVGGVLRNEEGQPIAGAMVNVDIEPVDWHDQHMSGSGVILHYLDFNVKTDEHGRWTCTMAPETWNHAYIQPDHPDYYCAQYLTEITDRHALLDGTAETKLIRGRSLSGRVLDASGKGVAGAKVVVAGSPATRASDDGTFTLPHASPDAFRALAYAKDQSPVFKNLPAGDVKDLEIRLPAPHALHGKVVDDEGKPLSGAYVLPVGWEGSDRMYFDDWSVRTDADGQFSVFVPPAVVSNLSLLAEGFGRAEAKAPDDGKVLTITLHRERHITGHVTNAITGIPIQAFLIRRVSEEWLPEGVQQEWGEVYQQKNGVFDLTLDSNSLAAVRIEAEGYRPLVSAVVEMHNGTAALDARLEPCPPVKGLVVDAAGAPVPSAQVRVISPHWSSIILDEAWHDVNEPYYPRTQSDSQGRFAVPVDSLPYTVFVLADAGYAKVDGGAFEKSSTIHLTPWASVSGKVAAGSMKLLNDSAVEASGFFFKGDINRVYLDIHAKIDSSGKYVFPHVPAGAFDIESRLKLADGKGTIVKSQRTTTASGQAMAIDFVTSGASLTGSATLAMPMPSNSHFAYANLNRINGSDDSQLLQYNTPIDKDGHFAIACVAPGNYQMKVNVVRDTDMKSVAELTKAITISSTEKGVDVSSLELVSFTLAKVGETAPDFACPTLDGTTLRLSDYRGKYVLLDFWATWCAPCVAELPAIKKLNDAFAREHNVTIIGLDLDTDAKTAKAFVEKNAYSWTQGFLGDWGTAPVVDSYGVQGIPSTWLIAPDGTILANDLAQADDLQIAIEKAMGK